MSFSAKQYFAYEQRRLEPTGKIITGNYRRHHEVKKYYVVPKVIAEIRTEREIEVAEDEYLRSKGLN